MKKLINTIVKNTKKMDVDSLVFEKELRKYYKKITDGSSFLKEAIIYVDMNKEFESELKIFYFLQFYLRYQKDFADSEKLFQKFEYKFGKTKTFVFLESLYYAARTSVSWEEAITILEKSKSLAELYEKNPGFPYTYAKLFCNIYEMFPEKEKHLEDQHLGEAKKALHLGFKELRRLGEIDSTFHAVNGRLLSIEGKYNEAIIETELAISLENSSRPDYAIVIGGYQKIINDIQMKKNSKKLLKITKKLEDKVSNISKRDFSILTIFVSIATFAIGGVSIAKSFPPYDAGVLLVTTFASLTVFISLAIIPIFKDRKTTIFASIIASIAIIAIICLLVLAW